MLQLTPAHDGQDTVLGPSLATRNGTIDKTDGLWFEYKLIQKIRFIRHASDLCVEEPRLFLDA